MTSLGIVWPATPSQPEIQNGIVYDCLFLMVKMIVAAMSSLTDFMTAFIENLSMENRETSVLLVNIMRISCYLQQFLVVFTCY